MYILFKKYSYVAYLYNGLSYPVTEVRKSPDVGKINCKSDDGEKEIQIAVPSYALRFVSWSCEHNAKR